MLPHQQEIFLRGKLLLVSKKLVDFGLGLDDLRLNLSCQFAHLLDVVVDRLDLVAILNIEVFAQLFLKDLGVIKTLSFNLVAL